MRGDGTHTMGFDVVGDHSNIPKDHDRAAARRLAFLGVCTRGAGTSLYDYADFAERLLQVHVSHVFCCCSASPDPLFRRNVLTMRTRFGADAVREIARWPPNATTDVDPLLSASRVSDFCAFRLAERHAPI